ncbi:hypothetical protein HJFPF1_01727 [Paramyrothecium foliicola]|nr:hypothetical protein HJFPF1_01727 [Paramyrothecium foliicola]
MAMYSQDIDALLERRRLTVIPKDQLALLERSDSWAVDLANTSRGLVNVPTHVLRTVKEAYIAKHLTPTVEKNDGPTSKEATPSQSLTEDPSRLECNSPVASPLNTQGTWSITPPERLRPRWQNAVSPAYAETPKGSPINSSPLLLSQTSQLRRSPRRTPQGHEARPSSRDKASIRASKTLSNVLEAASRDPTPSRPTPQRPQGQKPSVVPNSLSDIRMAPPPRPSPPRQQAPAFDFASSDNEEQITEVQRSHNTLSGTISKDVADLQNGSGPRQGQTTFTPPCAQLSQSVVPETVIKDDGPVVEAAETEPRRRHRIMKRHTFSDDSPVAVKPRKVLAPNKAIVIGSSASIPSSVVASTISEAPTQKPSGSPQTKKSHTPKLPQAEEKRSAEADPQTNNHAPLNLEGSVNGNSERTSIVPSELSPPQTVPQASIDESVPTTQAVGMIERGFPDPFHAFALIYPAYTTSYSGSVLKFVRACVCLDYLRQERALRDFLYDDFIRSFSAGYLAYVKDAGPGQEPLPALEWYNIQSGSPKFTKMVVNKKNLDVILKTYPEEVAQARSVIMANTEPTEEIIRPARQNPVANGTMEVDGSPHSPQQESRANIPAKDSRRSSPDASNRPSSEYENMLPLDRSRDAATPASSLGQRRASRYLEKLASGNRSRPKRRAQDHSERLREHFKKRLSTGSVGFVSSGSRLDSTPNP